MDKITSIFLKIYEPISPKQFDANEWWTLFITFLVLFTVFYLHRKHQRIYLSSLIFIFLFNIYYASLGDYVLAVKPIDLYDTVDRDSGEIFDIPLHMLVYPGVIYIFQHYFLWKQPRKVPYYIICGLILTLLEWLSVHFFHLFLYKEWKLVFSIPFYIIVMVINLKLFLYVHYRFEKETKTFF
jgi:hypothetical protein